MKNLLLLFLLFCLGTVSCKKTETETPLPLAEDGGCISRKTVPVTVHGVSATDVTEIQQLFSQNNISYNNYQYYQYRHDSLQTLYPPYAKLDQKVVKLYEYTNGLRIFTGDMVFIFMSDRLNYRSSNGTGGTTLSNTPRLKLSQIRKLFIDNVEQFDHKGNQYKDTCLNAEFGYYNINSGRSNTPEVLIKAWRVTRKNSTPPSEYPQAYYQDSDGKLIYYDNGIRTFR